jgi:hypothetical protein
MASERNQSTYMTGPLCVKKHIPSEEQATHPRVKFK